MNNINLHKKLDDYEDDDDSIENLDYLNLFLAKDKEDISDIIEKNHK
jgi:hypothetical protein